MKKYTVVKVEDAPNVLGKYPGEMRFLKNVLNTEQVAVTYRRMPKGTGSKGYYGHTHEKQEEIVYVMKGRLQVKVDDDIVELGPNSAIRIPPGATQGVFNDEDEDVELLIISNRMDPGDKVTKDTGFWH